MNEKASTGAVAATRHRTLFLSDIHLATRSCKAEALLQFLKENDADEIFLVGDVIDFWRLRRAPRWPASHTLVIRELMAKAKAGSRVIYIPGNHDDELRQFAGTVFGPVELRLRALHQTASGKKFLVVHGDEFDVVIRKAVWLAVLGDIGYEIAMAGNVIVNAVRRLMGLPYWSLSAYLKYRVKRAVNYVGNFEELLVREARAAGAEGVICGHIHHAAMREVEGISYVNTGDWVESLTAVVERHDGELEIIQWRDAPQTQKKTAAARATLSAGIPQ